MRHPAKPVPITVIIIVSSVMLVGLNLLSPTKAGNFGVPQNQEKDKRTREEEEFMKEGPGPKGDWGVSAVPDLDQYKDPDAPAVIISTKSRAGNGKWRNLIVSGIAIENRSSKNIRALTLKWALANKEDRAKNLLKGETTEIQTRISGGETKFTKTPSINFAKIVKPLLKDESLEGDFLLIIAINTLDFEDGSS